jgi:hypothetical protein
MNKSQYCCIRRLTYFHSRFLSDVYKSIVMCGYVFSALPINFTRYCNEKGG